MITKELFTKLTGEDPIDILGPDWENIAQDYLEENDMICSHCGGYEGNCHFCKMD